VATPRAWRDPLQEPATTTADPRRGRGGSVISLTPKVSPMWRNERPSARSCRALASRSGLMSLGRPPLRPRSAAVATLVGCAEGRSYQASGSAGRQTGTPAWRSDSGRGRGTLKKGCGRQPHGWRPHPFFGLSYRYDASSFTGLPCDADRLSARRRFVQIIKLQSAPMRNTSAAIKRYHANGCHRPKMRAHAKNIAVCQRVGDPFFIFWYLCL